MCLSVDGHLGNFHILAIMNYGTMNMGVKTAQDPDFGSFGYMPRRGTAGSYMSSLVDV